MLISVLRTDPSFKNHGKVRFNYHRVKSKYEWESPAAAFANPTCDEMCDHPKKHGKCATSKRQSNLILERLQLLPVT